MSDFRWEDRCAGRTKAGHKLEWYENLCDTRRKKVREYCPGLSNEKVERIISSGRLLLIFLLNLQ